MCEVHALLLFLDYQAVSILMIVYTKFAMKWEEPNFSHESKLKDIYRHEINQSVSGMDARQL